MGRAGVRALKNLLTLGRHLKADPLTLLRQIIQWSKPRLAGMGAVKLLVPIAAPMLLLH